MLKIKDERLPTRCDICHQSDQFDPATGVCQRCDGVEPVTINREIAFGPLVEIPGFGQAIRWQEPAEDMAMLPIVVSACENCGTGEFLDERTGECLFCGQNFQETPDPELTVFETQVMVVLALVVILGLVMLILRLCQIGIGH
ncbi:MAG TPA: hypothetical protein PLB18_02970 [Acidobacteriota bacterium]|nr:hypothetical protein [Acidobacteriota bacterium]HND18307.1 hypothetical protein [Acidobacteriota bacterium]HNG92297.1 hypothetical protein [Acidobacteriota bacterium]HNH84779.1 hypothetical protein [Acidobacteriota bacterium]